MKINLKKFYFSCLILLSLNSIYLAQEKTVINDASAKTKLVGNHKISLQWISWDYFGTAKIVDEHGVLRIKGEQKQRGGNDFLKIDGTINSVDKNSFVFNGTITISVSHINNGNACKREGEMTFAIKGNRRYWRLQEMENPCDEATDYVDIYFR